MRRYLSLLDVAVALEVQGYDGPRLDPRYRVCMFDGALTADEVNHKYRCEGKAWVLGTGTWNVGVV